MNCAECRDNLVACAEGLLNRETLLECQTHLAACAACRAEYDAISSLQKRLVSRGQAAAEVSLVEPVMRRVLQNKTEPKGESIMSKILRHRWGFGLGAAASAAAIGLFILVAFPKAQATAAEAAAVMTKGAQAVGDLVTVHLRGQLRTAPQDNFSYINVNCPFCTVELWKQYAPDLKWRAEKPLRVAVMDGQSTVMLIKTTDTAVRVPQRSTSAFDTDWLQRIANISGTITNELNYAMAKGWGISLGKQTSADGRAQDVVTIEAKSGLPANDYLKNQFFDTADTRRVFVFDDQTERLEAMEIYVHGGTNDTLVFNLDEIDYNQPIDTNEWALALPADVSWYQNQMPVLTNNAVYAAMTAEQAAQAFFEACSKSNWDEAGKFMSESPVPASFRQYLGGLQIVKIGAAFTSAISVINGDQFVPYEIKLPAQEINVRVSNSNAAKRYVVTGIYDSQLKLQQDLKWSGEPEILTNNDDYARLSPKEAVQAYFDAQAKLDWNEMRKFTSEYDVEDTQGQVKDAEKAGLDVRTQMPVLEVGDATWSPEQNAWFVKCHMMGTKKWNLALRKDKATGRWFVDGGI
jgi:hypothetical protein